jgi:hypothetical protein
MPYRLIARRRWGLFFLLLGLFRCCKNTAKMYGGGPMLRVLRSVAACDWEATELGRWEERSRVGGVDIQAVANSVPGHTTVSSPVANSDPVEELDRAVDAVHRVNRALPKTVLGREELIAIGGLLTQISCALLTLTDLLGAPAHHCDRTRLLRADTDATPAEGPPAVTSLLQGCRDGYLAAHASARAFHAHLR